MASVTFDRVSKVYDNGFRAVDDLDLEIRDGEFMVLVGPSGCGKTTALRMLAGLEEISEGELVIDNTVVNEVAPQKRDIAMVFQNYALYPHLSVRANLGFGLKLRKTAKGDIAKRVDEVAKILGQLREIAPGVILRPTQSPPVLGAALYALDQIGADGEAHERVRKELATNG